MIKNILTAHKENFTTHKDELTATEFYDQFRFSSQVLRCCQKLYHESAQILYEENILEVTCFPDRDQDSRCTILNAFMPLPYDILTMKVSAWEPSNWKEQIDARPQTGPIERLEFYTRRLFCRNLAIVQDFRQLEICVDFSWMMYHFIICRVLAGLVHGEGVTLTSPKSLQNIGPY